MSFQFRAKVFATLGRRVANTGSSNEGQAFEMEGPNVYHVSSEVVCVSVLSAILNPGYSDAVGFFLGETNTFCKVTAI